MYLTLLQLLPTFRTLQKNLENFSEKERKKNRKISEKIRKINQEKILGDLIFNPSSVWFLRKIRR